MEVLVNGVDYGLYTGITGQVQVDSTNSDDTVVVDSAVSINGVVNDPTDELFAELATGASWLLS